MPWERAGVTLQGPGLSNCASLFNRLLCFSIHFIHCYSSASAFLPPSTVGTGQPLLQHSTVVQGTAGQGVLAPPPCNQGPLPSTAATATAHLHICAKQGHQALKNAIQSFAALFDQCKWPTSTPLWPLHCPSFTASSTRTSSITVVNIKHLVRLWLFQWLLMLILLTFVRRSNLGKFSKLFGQRLASSINKATLLPLYHSTLVLLWLFEWPPMLIVTKQPPRYLVGRLALGKLFQSIWPILNCYQLFQSIWPNLCCFRPGLLVRMQTSTATDLVSNLTSINLQGCLFWNIVKYILYLYFHKRKNEKGTVWKVHCMRLKMGHRRGGAEQINGIMDLGSGFT